MRVSRSTVVGPDDVREVPHTVVHHERGERGAGRAARPSAAASGPRRSPQEIV